MEEVLVWLSFGFLLIVFAGFWAWSSYQERQRWRVLVGEWDDFARRCGLRYEVGEYFSAGQHALGFLDGVWQGREIEVVGQDEAVAKSISHRTRLEVKYSTPLPLGFCVGYRQSPDLFRVQGNVCTGDDHFDRWFFVQGEDPEGTAGLLLDPKLRQLFVACLGKAPHESATSHALFRPVIHLLCDCEGIVIHLDTHADAEVLGAALARMSQLALLLETNYLRTELSPSMCSWSAPRREVQPSANSLALVGQRSCSEVTSR